MNTNEQYNITDSVAKEQAFRASTEIDFSEIEDRYGYSQDGIERIVKELSFHDTQIVTNGDVMRVLESMQQTIEDETEVQFNAQYDYSPDDALETPHAWNCECTRCWTDDQPF